MSDRCISRSGRRGGACEGEGGGAEEIEETPEARLSGRKVPGEWSFMQEGRTSSYGWDQENNGSVCFPKGKVDTVIGHFHRVVGGSREENPFPRSVGTPRGLRKDSFPHPPKMREVCLCSWKSPCSKM